jgi:hypothetical protein
MDFLIMILFFPLSFLTLPRVCWNLFQVGREAGHQDTDSARIGMSHSYSSDPGAEFVVASQQRQRGRVLPTVHFADEHGSRARDA